MKKWLVLGLGQEHIGLAPGSARKEGVGGGRGDEAGDELRE